MLNTVQQLAEDQQTAALRALVGVGNMPDLLRETYIRFLSDSIDVQLQNPNTGKDLRDQLATYRPLLEGGVKIIIVAHSQGNAFANSAFNILVAGSSDYPFSFDPSRISIVAVASPASVVASGDPWTTLFFDVILNAPTNPLPANTGIAGTVCGPFDQILCHEFVASYLTGDESRPKILNQIIASLPPVIGALPVTNTQDIDTLSARFACTSSQSGNFQGYQYLGQGIRGSLAEVRIKILTPPPTFYGKSAAIDVFESDAQIIGPVNETTARLVWRQGEGFVNGVTINGIDGVVTFSSATVGAGYLFQPSKHYYLVPRFFTSDGGGICQDSYLYGSLNPDAYPNGDFVGDPFVKDLYFDLEGLSYVSVPPAQLGVYSLTDLGDLPGGADGSTAFAVNALGEVVGQSSGAPDADYTGCGSATVGKPFIYRSGGMQVLRTPPLLDFNGSLLPACSGIAWGINDRGDVVGQIDYGFIGRSRPFVWTAASGMRLVADGNWPGMALDINNAGQVVGQMMDAAFRWTAANGLEWLEPVGTIFSTSRSINENGQTVGSRWLNCGAADILIWITASQRAPVVPTTNCSAPLAINDASVVVGTGLFYNTTSQALIWAGGIQRALGQLPSQQGNGVTEPSSINNKDVVVGTSNGKAFLWTIGTGIKDLNTLIDQSGIGWTLLRSTAINDLGQIAGYGSINGGPFRAFLLTPK